MAVRTTVGLPWSGRMVRQNLLAGEGAVAVSATIAIPAHIAIGMTNIVAILFIEHIICDFGERGAPENETFLEGQPDAFEEKGVLQTAEMFQMRVAAEGAVEMGHAEGEGGGEGVDVAGGDVGAGEGGGGGAVGGIGGGEILGQVVEDGG